MHLVVQESHENLDFQIDLHLPRAPKALEHLGYLGVQRHLLVQVILMNQVFQDHPFVQVGRLNLENLADQYHQKAPADPMNQVDLLDQQDQRLL